MRKQKKSKSKSKSKGRSEKKSVVDWVGDMDKDAPRMVVPVGPRFQATVPELTMSEPNSGNCPDDSSWLGVTMWPISENSCNSAEIGRGKPDSCDCVHPGSVKCVNRHVGEERQVLMRELGPAFKEWKLDTMGEEVSKSWTVEQQKRFDNLVKMNPVTNGQTFLDSAVTCFRSKTREEIVNYYLNVHIPRRFSEKTRSGSLLIDTDDETEHSAEVGKKKPRVEDDDDGSNNVKQPRYLVGRR